ncbi:CD91 [Mytilus edulis]|uniref:LRP1 n=1 Tax=Mytilus edulis TaxID=6550 RepID=A0A8S3TL73_MYTED|nr:CD91 [Mytilus edulis]
MAYDCGLGNCFVEPINGTAQCVCDNKLTTYCSDSQCMTYDCGLGNCFVEPINGTAQCVCDNKQTTYCSAGNCQCLNGGKCVTRIDGQVVCECIGQWTGEFCQESQCMTYDCGLGNCFVEPINGTAQCVCDNKLTTYCSESQCMTYDCGLGNCFVEPINGTAQCVCDNKQTTYCSTGNCQCLNGGKCVTSIDGQVVCECIGQWTGEFCQESQCMTYDCGLGNCFVEPINGTAQCVCDNKQTTYCSGKQRNYVTN